MSVWPTTHMRAIFISCFYHCLFFLTDCKFALGIKKISWVRALLVQGYDLWCHACNKGQSRNWCALAQCGAQAQNSPRSIYPWRSALVIIFPHNVCNNIFTDNLFTSHLLLDFLKIISKKPGVLGSLLSVNRRIDPGISPPSLFLIPYRVLFEWEVLTLHIQTCKLNNSIGNTSFYCSHCVDIFELWCKKGPLRGPSEQIWFFSRVKRW